MTDRREDSVTTWNTMQEGPAKEEFVRKLASFRRDVAAVTEEFHKVIIGQDDVLRQLLATIFSRGHCLLEGVPGLGKTMMVSTLARIMDLSFKRIQFTPDLMPTDITGTTVIDEEAGRHEFRFVEGPIFANIILADEINRTPPKTQAALLESMQERQVTVGKTTHRLPQPFFVIATQNPIEQEGTYPLPEAQQDRFMFKVVLDYPSHADEDRIVLSTTSDHSPDVKVVMKSDAILQGQQLMEKVAAAPYVVHYATALVRATRSGRAGAADFVKDLVQWGAGPRASQFLIRGAKALAAMDGRLHVSTQDIREVALPVLRHRIATSFQAQSEGIDSTALVKKLIESVAEPKVEAFQKKEKAPAAPSAPKSQGA
jgi:MoxR-like ATPase